MALPMTDREIATHYRLAKDQRADIQVLADLCATDRDTIRAALEREGIKTPGRRGRKKEDAAADGTGAVIELPDGDGTAKQEAGGEVFRSIMAVLEAVPEWASKYTRDQAATLAAAMMRDFLEVWKITEITVQEGEGAEE